ncbi:shikimate dehydrogenase [Virgibacillus sp. W0181]|uniref:shikimate dehydrogenase n=1 Tax=Virgibacillus sp. W0181 TaxID=3391581 RepID=UPI003F47E6F8
MHYKLGLIGYPIQHSLSPWIHEQFFKIAKLSGSYRIMEIEPNASFSEELEQMREEGINGFNVTVPYKEKIIPYLDKVDENAKLMGAVNTVVKENGAWIGYNTDGDGYVRSLESNFPQLFTDKTANVLLVGAGGAARGIYYALIKAGFSQIDIANRTKESAENIKQLNNGKINTCILTLKEAENMLSKYDVIIQTTSVGMKPHSDKSIIQLNNLKTGSIVSDIVYQPLQTEFLKQAQEHDASIHYGHTMLLFQAQAAFEIWTGTKAETGTMDEELINILQGDE